jgi:hypothetical protein
LFTGFTLGAGFKGGIIHSLLALLWKFFLIVPLPIALLREWDLSHMDNTYSHSMFRDGHRAFLVSKAVFTLCACLLPYLASGSVEFITLKLAGPKYIFIKI